MAGYNKVILMGNLTRDPEIRYAPSGTPVANFGLAINRRYRQGDETKEEVCFVDIVVFGKQAETCGQYLRKGNGALIEGRLQMRKFETKEGRRSRSTRSWRNLSDSFPSGWSRAGRRPCGNRSTRFLLHTSRRIRSKDEKGRGSWNE